MLTLSGSFARAQAAYDNMSPPEHDEDECPECGAEVVKDDDGWKCTSGDCEWSVYPFCGDEREV